MSNRPAVPHLTGRETYFYLFSRSGFTESLTREAERDERLKLVSVKDLFDL